MELIVLHIPKTAGNSLRATLNAVYGRHAVTVVGIDIPNTENEINRQDLPQQTKVLTGHITYQQVAALRDQTGARVISFIRQPVDRYISHFFHFKRATVISSSKLNRWRRFVPLWIHATYPGSHNLMSRYLGEDSWRSLDFIGTVEEFEVSLMLLSKLLNWPVPALSQGAAKRNVNVEYDVSNINVPYFFRKLLLVANHRDIALYDEASRRLDEARSSSVLGSG